MSLVQEALKRKADEQQTPLSTENAGSPVEQPTGSKSLDQTLPPSGNPPPETPSAAPKSSGEPPPPAGNQGALKTLFVWILILIVLAGLAVGAFYAYSSGLLTPKPTTPEEQETVANATPIAETEPTTGQEEATEAAPQRTPSLAYTLIEKSKKIIDDEARVTEAASSLMEVPTEAGQDTTPTPLPVKSETKPTPVPPLPTAVPPVEKSTLKTMPVEAESVQPETAAGTPSAQDAPIVWPKIKLTGVMASKNKSADGLAVIDGQITSCGQRVQGIKLISVHGDGIVLEFQGEIRTLRVGGEMF